MIRIIMTDCDDYDGKMIDHGNVIIGDDDH